MNLHPHLRHSLLASALLLASGLATAAEPQVIAKELQQAKTYTVASAPIEPLQMDPPKLPDLTGFTAEAVQKKIDRRHKGKVSLRRMFQEDTLKEFVGGDNKAAEWVQRQHGIPQAIFVEDGHVDLTELSKKVPKQYFSEVEPGVYLARLPIVVGQKGILEIDGKVKQLRLSQEGGAFLVNDGKLFVTDTQVTGWREKDNGPATFRSPKEFRPFLLSWGGTETYIVNTKMASFGYAKSKSYGVSISQYTPNMAKRMGRPIIAGNTVYGTKKKHGIIVSREVNDSWIINNKSYDNKLSGVVIDRNSVNNLVAYNEIYRNHTDGITLYESGDNLIWGNKLVNNRRHGIRVRNSVNIRLYENVAMANGLVGVYGHIKDLSDTDRDIALDPFDTKVSLIVVGGELSANGSGPLSIDSPLSVELYKVSMLAPRKASGISLNGVLGERQDEILDLLVRQQKAVLIDPVERQTEMID